MFVNLLDDRVVHFRGRVRLHHLGFKAANFIKLFLDHHAHVGKSLEVLFAVGLGLFQHFQGSDDRFRPVLLLEKVAE